VVQESLTNIFRHAQATNARVRLDYIPLDGAGGAAEALRVVVEDDGVGICDTATRGLGLTGMNERVQGCGGRLNVAPLAGRGTQVEAVFPLAQIDEMALGVAE